MTISKALSSATRGMIIARPGHRFLIGDYRQIESLVVAWLAGQENILEDFRAWLLDQSLPDSYCVQASKLYLRQITKKDKDERQSGKTSILASQYQGGIAAGVKFSITYKINVMDIWKALWPTTTADERERADFSYLLYIKSCKKSGTTPVSEKEAKVLDVVKQRWRAANEDIVEYWEDLESTAIAAVLSKKPVKCGMITWFVNGPFLNCRLPSGRDLHYPFAQVHDGPRSRKLIYYHESKPGSGIWAPTNTYGGKFAENITQAISRDFMTHAMVLLEDAGYPAVLTSHDELVSEVRDDYGSGEEFQALMETKDKWGGDFPLAVGWFESRRYGKIG